jgi:hypothetical protein
MWVMKLYADAYGWQPPESPAESAAPGSTRMGNRSRADATQPLSDVRGSDAPTNSLYPDSEFPKPAVSVYNSSLAEVSLLE